MSLWHCLNFVWNSFTLHYVTKSKAMTALSIFFTSHNTRTVVPSLNFCTKKIINMTKMIRNIEGLG